MHQLCTRIIVQKPADYFLVLSLSHAACAVDKISTWPKQFEAIRQQSTLELDNGIQALRIQHALLKRQTVFASKLTAFHYNAILGVAADFADQEYFGHWGTVGVSI